MWKEKYKIGVELIDSQHKELFNRVYDFLRTVQNKGDWNEKLNKVKETMNFMEEYVVVHFNDEEAYQDKIGYPERDMHKQVHADFRATINNYVEVFNTKGFNEELVQEFGAKLMTWLIMHVGKADKKIAEYMESKGGDIQ